VDEHTKVITEADTDDVRYRLREALEAREEIVFAYLHGSFAEGLPFRDVDVAVRLDPALAMATDIFDNEMSLSVELTRSLRFPVDVHVLNGAPLGFQHNVLQGEVLLLRDEDELTDFTNEWRLSTWISPIWDAFICWRCFALNNNLGGRS